MPGLVGELHPAEATGPDGKERNQTQPRKPNPKLDPPHPAPGEGPVAKLPHGLADRSSRAHPAAERPAEDEGGEEENPEQNEAPGHDPLACPPEDDHGGEVKERGGEKDSRQGKQRDADLLSVHRTSRGQG